MSRQPASRYADLPLHYGKVPPWLASRMGLLGGAIIEAIVADYGKSAVLHRLSDPAWFQSFGCVLGMDWHSSGITTSVMGALKKAINPKFSELGIFICGGKGKHSKATPSELLNLAGRAGLNGEELVRSSKLSAKVDNTAIQDGYQLYLHSFIVTDENEWAAVQQGMNDLNGMARRYHWHSRQFNSFVQDPHTFIFGQNEGPILNLSDSRAAQAHVGIMNIVRESPGKMLPEIQKVLMPRHHEVTAADVNLKRLGSVLALAHEVQPAQFESLLMLEGVGPRTLQSLALVSEVIHGTPVRFEDPARFSFAHGGKDGHPFPVPTKVYDETISVLRQSVEKAKLGVSDKAVALKNLHKAALQIERDFIPNTAFEKLIQHERDNSWRYGGRTVFGKAIPPADKAQSKQLRLL